MLRGTRNGRPKYAVCRGGKRNIPGSVSAVVREMVERGNRWGDPSGTAANPEVSDCFVNNAACAERREILPT